MNLGQRLRSTELVGLAGDSAYVAVWQGAVSVADLVQLALISHLLGLEELGRLALVISVVVLVGQLFDLRIGTAVTTFGARTLSAGDMRGFAGVTHFGYLLDAGTGVAAFLVVAALAPVVGPNLIGDDGTLLIVLYGLTLLAATTNESSVSILRLFNRFRLLAAYAVGVETLRVGLVAIALFVWDDLVAVVAALLLHSTVVAGVNAAAAAFVFRRETDLRLTDQALEAFREKRAMLRMAIHTNVVSYARLAQVQLPTILLGALSGSFQVGIYKVGTAAATIVSRVTDPAYGAVLPRLSRLWAAGRRLDVRSLVLHASVLAAGVVGVVFVTLVLLRTPVVELLGGESAGAATTVLVVVAAGYAINAVLFWNTALLYAASQSGRVAAIAVASVVIQLGLLPPLIAAFDATGAAAALFASLAVTNAAATAFAVRLLARDAERAARTDDRVELALNRPGDGI